MQNEIDMDNRQIIEADYDTVSSFCKTVACLALLLLMIFASGYLFIYNALYISISKDIRYYGQLKTIGMITGQVEEDRRVSGPLERRGRYTCRDHSSGCPVKGCDTGPASRRQPGAFHDSSGPMIIWALAAAAVFAFLTNMTGCRKPAKMAGECSPVEAMKYVPARPHQRGAGAGGNRARCHPWLSITCSRQEQAAVIFASFIIAISVSWWSMR